MGLRSASLKEKLCRRSKLLKQNQGFLKRKGEERAGKHIGNPMFTMTVWHQNLASVISTTGITSNV